MAIDPSKLKPSDLTRLLNSTSLGTVIGDRQLYTHRQRAGFRISPDGRTINLFKYLAWLVDERHGPQPEQTARDYEAMKEAARARNAALSAAGRDIGELPEVVDPERREQCRTSFRGFCDAYFPQTFHLEWSDDHLRVIAKIEQAVIHGGLFAMAMPRGSGKALALDTPLPTPSGWTTMGDVRVGDRLFDERGQPCPVLAVSPVMLGRPCYEVEFSDGERIVCDADHLWTVEDRYSRHNPLTLPTRDMVDRVELPDSRDRSSHRYRIALNDPLQLPSADLPIEPYALGIWLGDGTSSSSGVTLFDEDAREIVDRIDGGPETAMFCNYEHAGRADAVILTRTGVGRTSFQGRLRQLNLLDNKHIPRAYLRASWHQRLCLLQGLMDTDGHVGQLGHCEITLKENALADDFAELLSSLGIKYGCGQRMVTFEGKRYGPYRRFHFVVYIDDDAISLERKRQRLKTRPRTRPLSKARHITAITPVPSVPVKCVQVASPSHLYLAGRKMVPTHNSSLAECACLWAMLYGHRDFVTLIGSDEGHALGMLDSIKTELEANDLLLEDFPAVCYPIHSLEGIANRCSGQLYKGDRTQIGWTANEIVLPTIADSEASGAIIRVAGITGRIRGMKFKRPDGQTVRPSLVILDDPQTDESARSLSQCATRERILAGAVLGLSGPGKKISGIMPCTVIRPGDMADRILDREKHPEWNGERTKMVYAFPENEKLWERYAEVRADSLRAHGDLSEATAFYVAHREEMDEGAEVAWEARFNHDEASALQHAMNLKLQDEAAFWAEYQNEPLPENVGEDEQLTVDEIAAKLNGHRRGEVPIGCNHLTMFIDVQGKLLYWVVCAWGKRLHRLPGGLRGVPRPETALLHAAGREPDAVGGQGGRWAGGLDLCGARSADRQAPGPGMAARRRGHGQDRALPDRRQLGNIDGCGLPVLPPERPRRRALPQPRTVRRCVQHPVRRVPQEARRPGGLELAHSQRARQTRHPARALRHQLLEELHPRPPDRTHGRPGLPLALRARSGRAPALRRTPHRRVPREDRGAWESGRRVEAAARSTRQPLARRHRRLCSGRQHRGRDPPRHPGDGLPEA
jgi:hypothetical protein